MYVVFESCRILGMSCLGQLFVERFRRSEAEQSHRELHAARESELSAGPQVWRQPKSPSEAASVRRAKEFPSPSFESSKTGWNLELN